MQIKIPTCIWKRPSWIILGWKNSFQFPESFLPLGKKNPSVLYLTLRCRRIYFSDAYEVYFCEAMEGTAYHPVSHLSFCGPLTVLLDLRNPHTGSCLIMSFSEMFLKHGDQKGCKLQKRSFSMKTTFQHNFKSNFFPINLVKLQTVLSDSWEQNFHC